jgi:pyruvate ferredoxin oxidoreductase gamma subunit
MIEVRFHGRGGQGAKLASRILGRSGFLAGLYIQDFPLYGAERRGAPIISSTRLSDQPIEQRGYLEEPDLVLVMDDSLLKETRAQIFHGTRSTTPIIVNSPGAASDLLGGDVDAAKLISLDLSAIARRIIGLDAVSAEVAAVAAKAIGGISRDAVAEAVRIECREIELPMALIEKNVLAALEVYGAAFEISFSPRTEVDRAIGLSVAAWPLPVSVRSVAPTIRHPASAALRSTGNWRLERPEIALDKCKRCFLCYLYCPEGAINLDADNFPHIDYDHCKGCMVCYEECPTDAVTRRQED